MHATPPPHAHRIREDLPDVLTASNEHWSQHNGDHVDWCFCFGTQDTHTLSFKLSTTGSTRFKYGNTHSYWFVMASLGEVEPMWLRVSATGWMTYHTGACSGTFPMTAKDEETTLLLCTSYMYFDSSQESIPSICLCLNAGDSLLNLQMTFSLVWTYFFCFSW